MGDLWFNSDQMSEDLEGSVYRDGRRLFADCRCYGLVIQEEMGRNSTVNVDLALIQGFDGIDVNIP